MFCVILSRREFCFAKFASDMVIPDFQTSTVSKTSYVLYFSLAVGLDISNTSITGDLCADIVEGDLRGWTADCLGDPPEVACPCCSRCCSDVATRCEEEPLVISVDAICQEEVKNVESDGQSDCECSLASPMMIGYLMLYNDSHNVSCHYIDPCATCNEDGTVCGTVESFYFTHEISNKSYRRVSSTRKLPT